MVSDGFLVFTIVNCLFQSSLALHSYDTQLSFFSFFCCRYLTCMHNSSWFKGIVHAKNLNFPHLRHTTLSIVAQVTFCNLHNWTGFMEAIVVSSKCPQDKASPFLTQNENLNTMFLAHCGFPVRSAFMWACVRSPRTRHSYQLPQLLCLGYLREVQRWRAACVTIVQMLQYIRNEKISQDFNIEEECWLCRVLASCMNAAHV